MQFFAIEIPMIQSDVAPMHAGTQEPGGSIDRHGFDLMFPSMFNLVFAMLRYVEGNQL